MRPLGDCMSEKKVTTEALRFAVGFGWRCRDEVMPLDETLREFEKVAQAYPTLPPAPSAEREG